MARLGQSEQANAQAIIDMKNKQFGMVRQVAKEQWIKTSFWMPENAEEELKVETNAAPANTAKPAKARMVCPYNRLRLGEEG